MDMERGIGSSSLASTPGDTAEDAEAMMAYRMEMEAAEILAALAHSKKRDAVSVAAEFAAKWGCKGKRVRKRVSSSESPSSDVGLNPVDSVQSGSDPAEDRATVDDQQQIQVTSTAGVIQLVETEQKTGPLNGHSCTARYTSNGEVKLRENVNEAELETCRLRRFLTDKDSDWQMSRERQILFGIVKMPEKDIWEDRQQEQMKGNNAVTKSIKTEGNDSVKSSPACATKYMSCGSGRSRQNLTEAEKEARRLRRILANRESARQTIRRRQALCENLTLKVADLTQENENLKKAKELALKEYQSQESTNKNLKAEMAKAIKAEEEKAPGEVKLARQISGSSRNCPFFFYNQHSFPSFCWPSIVQSPHLVQSRCGHQNAIFVPSSISAPTNGGLDSLHEQENPVNVNGHKTPFYVVPYPWFFPLPDHGSGLHPQPSCGPNNIKDETSVNNRFSAGSSLKSLVNEEEHNSSLPVEVEKEAYSSIEANSNNLDNTPVRLPPDGGGQCIRYNIKEEVFVSTPLCSAGATFAVELENKPDHVVNTEVTPIKPCHFVGALPEENQESTNYTNKKVLDAVAAAEARKRRKELTKLKNLHGRQCRVNH